MRPTTGKPSKAARDNIVRVRLSEPSRPVEEGRIFSIIAAVRQCHKPPNHGIGGIIIPPKNGATR